MFLCVQVLQKAHVFQAAVSHPCACVFGAGWGAAVSGVTQGTLRSPLMYSVCGQLLDPTHALHFSLS